MISLLGLIDNLNNKLVPRSVNCVYFYTKDSQYSEALNGIHGGITLPGINSVDPFLV